MKETTLSFRSLGKKYGVSGQAIFRFCDNKDINRPKKPMIEHTENCLICRSLIRIAKKPHSDFISSMRIKEELKIGKAKWFYHLRILRKKGLISQKFGKLQSKKVERAYQIYFKKRLPINTIGRQVGLKNFYSVIRRHKVSGWDVPAPLFRYDGNERRKNVLKMIKEKRSGKDG